ncbi:hypothetical protein [Ornithinimicrobium sp. INDO-MA30-4]|uniref:hypothetical protein n=1 Tax=Ornithinimicrobium sp. INDO-MA30-4 TaxID=2908651 RepID=UPI001F4256A0|nr:hypothetical protein [Ornithinimicrobium sp. INDO-MA30-4]UJH69783.1 hypothetical protein L0A91_10920 [Ornithinimicrobium sp. INDO-MA30-4]
MGARDYAESDALVFLQLSEDWWESDKEYNWSIRTPDGAIVGMCGLMRRQGEGSLRSAIGCAPTPPAKASRQP